jgi:membrane protein YqaA with SNARE-associated domain
MPVKVRALGTFPVRAFVLPDAGAAAGRGTPTARGERGAQRVQPPGPMSHTPPGPHVTKPPKKPGLVRRMYDWVLSWAETRYGVPMLMAISFAESSFFPIPPDVLQIALSVGKPRRSFLYAFASLVASVAGAVLGWWIGKEAWDSLGDFFFEWIPGFTQERFDFVGEKYQDNAFLAIFGAAFTPIPFKIFTIASGAFHVKLSTLILASLVGRGLRFFVVAGAIFFLGPRVKFWIDRYFELISIAFFVLIVLGVVAVKFMLH